MDQALGRASLTGARVTAVWKPQTHTHTSVWSWRRGPGPQRRGGWAKTGSPLGGGGTASAGEGTCLRKKSMPSRAECVQGQVKDYTVSLNLESHCSEGMGC